MNYIRSLDREGINDINMEYVQKKHNNRLKTRVELFEKILQRCYHRIDVSTDYKETFVFFQIPGFIYGFPIYNTRSCAAYLIKRLMANGFHVKFFKPNLLYIYWYYRDNPNYLTPLMNKPFRKELTFPDSKVDEPRHTPLHSLPEAKDEVKQEYRVPVRKRGKAPVNIPLPPINFGRMSHDEIQTFLPSNHQNYPEDRILDLPVSKPEASIKGTKGDFEVTLTERSRPRSRKGG